MRKKAIYLYIVAVLLSIIMFLPFIWGLILSFKSNYDIFNTPLSMPAKLDLGLYVDTFKQGHLLDLFKNSLIVTLISVVIGMFISFLSSFSIARLGHKSKKMSNFFYYLFLSATAVPAFILLMTIYNVTLNWGKINSNLGVDSLFGLILPYINGVLPFATLLYVGGMRTIPLEMEEAGIIDGCSLFSIIFKIDLPLLMPIVVTLFIFQFLGLWNEFPVASILLNSTEKFTIPLAMAFFKDQFSQDYGAMLRAVVMILLPQLIFYFIFQKQIMEGMATAGIKG